MEAKSEVIKEWRFNKGTSSNKKEVNANGKAKRVTVRYALAALFDKVNPLDERPMIPLGHGDPSPFACFRTTPIAEDAVADALRSASFNGYASALGLLPARKAVAEYISSDLPFKLSPDNVRLTVGCKQAIQAVISALAHSHANILLPMPGFAMYDAAAAYSGLEIRNYDLLPGKGWEVDLDSVEALVDENTAAIVIINPGNPCGNVYTHQHLKKIAETARKLGLLVIVDEVYEHITFGSNPFVRMGVFASIVPVITLGSISKRWMVPGWRLGWLVTTDPNGILQKTELLERVKAFLEVGSDPATFIQAAVPQIIEKTKGEYFSKVIDVLRQDADIIFEKLNEIPCITCPTKPEGSMFVMAKINVSMLDGIQDDMDFSSKLAEEEKVIVLPGTTMGMANWLRITFAIDPSLLEEGLQRIKAFCQRFNKGTSSNKKEVNDKTKRVSVRCALQAVSDKVNPLDERPLVPLGHGDPSPFACFRTTPIAEDAVTDALRSARFNGYPSPHGLLPARKAVAEYISRDLPYKLSPDDVCLTVGCKQAIQAVISALAHSHANILLPMPGYAMYDVAAAYSEVEIRNYDLLPEKGWEVDLDSVEAQVDENTAAIVIINPGNPCGNVYTHQHLKKVAETARKLGLLVIVDEVYEHITFGSNPFVRMGVFASIVPVITLGSISKRWIVPGWRLGWLVTTDPNGILQKSELLKRIKAFLEVASDPPTFIQAAVPQIIEKTKGEFFSKVIDVLRQDADISFEKLKEIPCITCPTKPEGSMFVMAKINVSMLDGIQDDMVFSSKLAEEEKVIVLPGTTMGMANWLRITFAIDPSLLEEGLQRIKAFCQRYAKEK